MLKYRKTTNQLSLRDFYHVPFQLYSIMGIKLFAWDIDDQMTLREKFSLAIILSNLAFSLCTKVAFVVFQEFENPLQLTAWTVYFGFATNSFFKMASVWLGRHTLYDVIMEMNKTFPSTAQEREEYRLRHHQAMFMRYMRFLFIFHWSVALMFMMFPIVQSSIEYVIGWQEDGAFVYRFPYLMKYFFDEYRPIVFMFVYATQFTAGLTVSCYFLGSDLLLVATVHLLNMQFAYLQGRIRRFKSKGPQHDLSELKAVVQYHSRILEYAERINNVFSFSILMNYLISILVVCLIGFQVVAGSGLLDLLKFVCFLCSSLMHVYFICFFGTNLMTLSEEISEALSCHEWYTAHLGYQRMLPIAIARAQRPSHLTAFKFFVISMESFTTLMTTSYQFFTLIKARYDEANELA